MPICTTLSLKSLSLLSSVCYKTTQTTGGVGVAGACPPTSKWSFRRKSGTSRPPIFEVLEFLPNLHLCGNCYKLAYLEPRTITKTSPV